MKGQLREGFKEEGTPDMKYYAFDWDDNIVHMPTKIIVKTEDGDEIGMSTNDFAKHREKIGKKNFKYNGEIIVGFGKNPFKNFRTEGDKDFLVDAMMANVGPAFDDFKEAINNGSIFSIITARGHHPNTLKRAVKQLIDGEIDGISKQEIVKNLKKYRDKVKGLPTEKLDDNTLINLYLEMCQFYPVTHGEGSATNPEDGKVKAMRKFISYVRQQAKLLQKDVEMIDDVSNSFVPQIGFSDDDERNLQAMINKLSDDEEKSLKMYTTKTGEKKKFQGSNTED
jgi:hypothetical protein